MGNISTILYKVKRECQPEIFWDSGTITIKRETFKEWVSYDLNND